MDVICILLTVYWVILIARVLASFFPIPPSGPVRSVVSIVYTLTEPVLRPLRGLLPPIRMGAVGFDLSPIIVFVALGILQRAICR
jgi:YggT family protein